MSSDSENEQEAYNNNPFTKYLIQKLGDKFDKTQFISRNKKMLRNMSALNASVALGEDKYQHTYLDRIKIPEQTQQDKPTHIEKLFEKEDCYLYQEEYETSNTIDKKKQK